MAHKGETENGTHYSEPPYGQFAVKGDPSARTQAKTHGGGRRADDFMRMIASSLGIPGILPQTTGEQLGSNAPRVPLGGPPIPNIAPAADAIEGPGIPDAILANQAKYAPTPQGPTTPSTPTPTTPTPLESGTDFVPIGGGGDVPTLADEYAGMGLGKIKPPVTGVQTEIPKPTTAIHPSQVSAQTPAAPVPTDTAEGPGLGNIVTSLLQKQQLPDWLNNLLSRQDAGVGTGVDPTAVAPDRTMSAGQAASEALNETPSLANQPPQTGAFGDETGRFSPADVLGTEETVPGGSGQRTPDLGVGTGRSTGAEQADLPSPPGTPTPTDIEMTRRAPGTDLSALYEMILKLLSGGDSTRRQREIPIDPISNVLAGLSTKMDRGEQRRFDQ